MSPTIALKCRLDHGLKRHADPRTSMITSPYRSVSIGSEAELLTTSSRFLKLSTENEAANLLLSMSNIVSEEIKTNSCVFDDKDDDNSSRDITGSPSHHNEMCLTPRATSLMNNDENLFVWNRVRTVSIDSPNASVTSSGNPAIVSPMNTPSKNRKPSRRQSQKAKRDLLKMPKMPQLPSSDLKSHKKKALQAAIKASLAKGKTMKKILRKKFSWKNYPGTSDTIPLLYIENEDVKSI